jgi:hypothetical protein
MKRRTPFVSGIDAKRLKRSYSEPSDDIEVVQERRAGNFKPGDYYRLVENDRRRWRGGPVRQNMYQVRLIRSLPTSDSFERQIMLFQVLESAFQRILEAAPPNASAQVIAENVKFRKWVIATCRTKASQLTFHHLADRLDAVLQSDDTVDLTETKLTLTTFATSHIGSQPHRPSMANRRVYDEREYCKLKRSLYNPTTYSRLKARHGLCVPLIIARELHAMETGQSNNGRRLSNYLRSPTSSEEGQSSGQTSPPFTCDWTVHS